MFFHFFNTSTKFQSYISKILAKKLDVSTIVYLDTIFIYTDKTNHVIFI